jgi:hypothetical protein
VFLTSQIANCFHSINITQHDATKLFSNFSQDINLVRSVSHVEMAGISKLLNLNVLNVALNLNELRASRQTWLTAGIWNHNWFNLNA